MTEHPITPPPELVEQWAKEWKDGTFIGRDSYIATQAARWGADLEMESCIELLGEQLIWDQLRECTKWKGFRDMAEALIRNARRPKPPSLKQQAMKLLSKKNGPVMLGTPEYRLSESDAETIRRALELLND